MQSHLAVQSQWTLTQFSQAVFQDQLIQTILDLNMSFHSVEHLSFVKLLNLLCSDVQTSHWTKFSQLIKKCVKKLKEIVLAELRSKTKISLTLNCWTSLNNLAFLSITEYFIDKNWDYWEILLEFQSLWGQHSEKNLTKVVMNVLNSYEILNRLLIITADNVFNNVTLHTELTTILWKWRIN